MCLLMEINNNANNTNTTIDNHKAKMSLVLSTDAKPRLKWTCDLHHKFIEAVNQLGGPNKATPKGLMKVMEIPGLTLYHLKSHLQKYRLGKSMKFDDNKLEVSSASENQEVESKNDSRDLRGCSVTEENSNPAKEGLQITEALQMQMEVQKKLHEQIEVQRHLQVKIEAQGKYLQSVLMKAQQTLAGYSSSNLGMDFARTELSRLASMVNRGCPSTSFSELTQVEEEEEGFLWYKKPENRGISQLRCSVESSLTSSETSETKLDTDNNLNKSIELPLMEINSEVMKGKKRSINDVVCVEQPLMKRAFGVDDDEHLKLSLNTYKKDMEACTNIGLGFN
ncbi:Homeodomain-like superfamily protein [Arabidopsis thaliana]|uniref:Myb family transcription factor PHL8 n=1 Tax=Arabidopsis thaliana TaxID=3702 RepID=PHL8_ARATH|nr:Homeodomain-like superfamily protein [Arabidopsis thaliana]F4I274.1 RecName: Full=Myb family transcription factor PHL8; AltName: Full=Protein PHR1-LIKE 8 [Arabidopsis thaliana]AEE34951.1 Homeodomain-like superfamily protein [Arabidopsis thaliana]|eukprot:NP_177117.2 Homeodomain-like superfamily protein [Arabidopsis thaliana]